MVNKTMTEALRPYLLGGVNDRIRVCWEGPEDGDYQLNVESKENSGNHQVHRPTFQNHADGIGGIYNVEVSGLVPGKAYSYQVRDRNGTQAGGSFRLSESNGGSARYLVMTDPHAFNLKNQIAEVATSGGYDAILHLGDMPSGTGFQRDQYQSGWFEAFEGPLADLPMFYAPGNHDDGPHFDTYFGPQSQSLNSDSTGRSFSFTDATNTHFVFLDSNPWSLSQMNAVNSGIAVPEETAALIEETKRWLISDLESEAARQANWRVVLLHHPYTDEFTNRHIIPIVEAHQVDLVLSGHLHKYHKSVPIGTGAVPRPVYVTVPSCQDAAVAFQRSSGSERLMGDYPEVVAIGDGNYMDLDVTPEALRLTIYGWGAEGLAAIDTIVIDKVSDQRGLQFSDHLIGVDEERGCVYLTARVANTSDGMRVAVAPVLDNGTQYALHFSSEGSRGGYRYLDGGEAQTMTFRHELHGSGDHLIEFGDQKQLVQISAAAQIGCDEPTVNIDRANSMVEVEVQLTSHGKGDSCHAVLELCWDEVSVATLPVTVECGTAQSGTLSFQYPEGGRHQAQVYLDHDLVKSTTLDCGGAIAVIPAVRDKSVWGNDALVRGNPRLILDGDRLALSLEADGDYLEIPPAPSMQAPEGFTALVRANVSRLANPDEMAHSPLFVRGKSVGWGATYFVRMVIDRNGTMKWGTCHGSSEYGWAGGHAQVGKWADYLLEFTKAAGGNCEIDAHPVAAVPPLAEGSALNEYSEMPTFIGYSYIGHVIEEIGRPMYYTHLPAAISEVVFGTGIVDSTAAVSSGWEAKAHPEVRANLDFGDISTAGAFTSGWRQFRKYQKQYFRDVDSWQIAKLRVGAEIPEGCQATLIIEVADDGDNVSASSEVPLRSGEHTYCLPAPISGQFVRIRIEMVGKVALGEPIAAPKVSRVEVQGTQADLSACVLWSTPAQWALGEFTGNVGMEPMDRLHIFDQFTDPIHG